MKEYRESELIFALPARRAAAITDSSYAILFPIYQWLTFYRKTN